MSGLRGPLPASQGIPLCHQATLGGTVPISTQQAPSGQFTRLKKSTSICILFHLTSSSPLDAVVVTHLLIALHFVLLGPDSSSGQLSQVL